MAKAKGVNTPVVKEADLQRAIMEMAQRLGWVGYHTLYSIGSEPGYPDLTLAHPEYGVMWIEVKGPRGKTSPAQVEWIDRLRAAGQTAYVVFPDDMDAIERILQGERPEDTAA